MASLKRAERDPTYAAAAALLQRGRRWQRRSRSNAGPSSAKQGTWGVALVERENGRFVVLPQGTLEYPPWTVDGRPAVRLSSEWRSSMTELERRLTDALSALAKQYEREQRRAGRAVRGFRRTDAAARNVGRGLAAAGRRARTASRTLDVGLQGDRRRVERRMNHIRQITR